MLLDLADSNGVPLSGYHQFLERPGATQLLLAFQQHGMDLLERWRIVLAGMLMVLEDTIPGPLLDNLRL